MSRNAVGIQIDNIATDLNGKADVDLTNVNSAGTSTGASWAMPSDTYDTLTWGATGATYTAPANGWFAAEQRATGSACHLFLLADNKCVSSDQIGPSYSGGVRLYAHVPVKKGDVVTLIYGNIETSILRNLYFIYAEGSESEAQHQV